MKAHRVSVVSPHVNVSLTRPTWQPRTQRTLPYYRPHLLSQIKKKGLRRASNDTELMCACLVPLSPTSLPGRRKKSEISAFVCQSASAFPRCSAGRPSCRHLCDVLFSNQMARSDDLESNQWPSCPAINVAVGQRRLQVRMNVAEI